MSEWPAGWSVGEVLGEGGSSVVYAAHVHGQRVALKVPRRDTIASTRQRERFLAEAKLLARVRHASLIEITGSGVLPDGRPYITMPRLDGETLASRLAQSHLPVDAALAIFARVAEALSALHAEGLVHRDLKPENVFLVEPDERPVLLDLGIAREEGSAPSRTTEEGFVKGTPATMAPERFFGTGASTASDVYELALLLYAMLAGRLPWGANADADARLSPEPLVKVAPWAGAALSDEVMVALSTRVERRPASVAAFVRAVLEASPMDAVAERKTADAPRAARSNAPPAGDTPSAAGATLPPAHPARRRVVWPAVSVVAISAAVAAWVFRAPSPEAPASAMLTTSSSPAAVDSAPAPAAELPIAIASTPASAPEPSAAPPRAAVSASAAPAKSLLPSCRAIVEAQCAPPYGDLDVGRRACPRARANYAALEREAQSIGPRRDAECKDALPGLRAQIDWVVLGAQHKPRDATPPLAFVPHPEVPKTMMPWTSKIRELMCSPEARAAESGELRCRGWDATLSMYADKSPEERAAADEGYHRQYDAIASGVRTMIEQARAARVAGLDAGS